MTNDVTKPIPDDKPEAELVVRPWGSFAQYAHNNKETTVSLMTVKAGERLSLQSQTRRAELWIVLDDGAAVQIGSRRILRGLSKGKEMVNCECSIVNGLACSDRCGVMHLI